MSMQIYTSAFRPTSTPQTEPIPGRTADMVPNSTGGYAFPVGPWEQLKRFLILGTAGGTYYAKERELTKANAGIVLQCVKSDAARTIAEIIAVSDGGRAPKNEPALFALAICAAMGDEAAKKAAMAALPRVARTGTHLFDFVAAVDSMRGWGRTLRDGIAGWYTGRAADSLAYQAVKYQSRNGWSHKDVLRLSHATSADPAYQAVFRWIVAGADGMGERVVRRGDRTMTYPDLTGHLPRIVEGFELAKKSPDAATTARLVSEYRLPRECVLTQHLNDPVVWEALLPHMGPEALIRNLGKMTAIGFLAPMSATAKQVCDKLGDAEAIRGSRLHPMEIVVGLKQYAQGRGEKGKLTWSPVSQVNDALDAAFYLAFPNVEPANKRTLIAIDCSDSMTWVTCGSTCLQPREAAAVFAMITARSEPNYQLMGFSDRLVDVPITATTRLVDAVRIIGSVLAGSTDCSLPMFHALDHRWPVDTFYVLTDHETYFGVRGHPSQALVQYRRAMNIPARLVVAAFTATNFSIADPNDAGMMDVVGLDSATPQLLADFSAGRI